MVQSAKDRIGGELAEPLDWPMRRRILAQRPMRSNVVLIALVGATDAAQMRLAEVNDVHSRRIEPIRLSAGSTYLI
jgi:hypothetical protein